MYHANSILTYKITYHTVQKKSNIVPPEGGPERPKYVVVRQYSTKNATKN